MSTFDHPGLCTVPLDIDIIAAEHEATEDYSVSILWAEGKHTEKPKHQIKTLNHRRAAMRRNADIFRTRPSFWYRNVTDRQTDLLYQYRASVCWHAIKSNQFECKCQATYRIKCFNSTKIICILLKYYLLAAM